MYAVPRILARAQAGRFPARPRARTFTHAHTHTHAHTRTHTFTRAPAGADPSAPMLVCLPPAWRPSAIVRHAINLRAAKARRLQFAVPPASPMLLRFSNFIGEFVEQVGLLAPRRPRCMTREARAARGFRSPGADVGRGGPSPGADVVRPARQ